MHREARRQNKKSSLPVSLLEGVRTLLTSEADPCGFDRLARGIFEWQLAANPAYQRFCAQRSVTEWPGDWKRIPALPQSAFKDATIACFDVDQAEASFHTSGTTGERYGIHYIASLDLARQAVVQGWKSMQLPSLPQLVLIPPANEQPHSSLSAMMMFLKETAFNGDQLQGLTMDHGLLRDTVRARVEEARARNQSVLLLGTTLSLLHWLEKEPLPLPEESFLFHTGGFKGVRKTLPRDEVLETFHAGFEIPSSRMINEYGMTELTSQFYSIESEGLHRGPPWIRGVIVDPVHGEEVATGESGILKIIDLTNVGSVLAVETQDLAVREQEGFRLLGRDPAALPRGCSRSADELLEEQL